MPAAGDTFSLKQICSGDDRLWRLFGRQPKWTDNFGRPLPRNQPDWFTPEWLSRLRAAKAGDHAGTAKPTAEALARVDSEASALVGKAKWLMHVLSPQQLQYLYRLFNESVRTYYEIPPIWSGANRFGVPTKWWRLMTADPLLRSAEADEFVKRHGLGRRMEARRYTHILYVRTSA